MSESRIQWPSYEGAVPLIELALREDGDGCDVTSEAVVAAEDVGGYAVIARESGVFAGRGILRLLTGFVADEGLAIRPYTSDGEAFEAGRQLATIVGPARTALRIERPLLNFLQRLCGVATLTRQFVDAVAGTSAQILDTRKTIPGWRELDKYAVRCGGGVNHRMGLHDAVLVKDNHLAGVPVGELRSFVADLVARVRRNDPPPSFIELEVDSLDQLGEVLAAEGVDRVLLDNFTPDQMRQAVAMRNASTAAHVKLEASGGIDLQNVRAIAETGVDFISVGALTHSAPSLDLAIDAVQF